MGKKEDLQRALAAGKDEYYKALQSETSYQKTLQKLKDTRPEKSWIQSPFGLPKFTTDEYEAALAKYQAKYGSKLNVPGFEDVIQWKPRITITNEEMAAHLTAQKKGLPSPLSDDQLASLASKKLRFLKMLQQPNTYVQRQITAVATAADNAEDALVTFVVLGRLARWAAPRALSRLTPVLGWAQTGSDLLNLINIAAQVTKKAYSNKRLLEKKVDNNPFHKKFYAQDAKRLSKTWPGFGEVLEIAQTTDQIFGVGLCLGGLMSTVQDVLIKGVEQLGLTAANIISTAEGEESLGEIWADAIEAASIVWNAKDWVDNQTLEQVTLAASESMAALMPTWLQVESPEFLQVMKAAGQKKKKYTRVDTKYVLQELGIDPSATPKWPMLEVETASLEELAYTYGPRIKDNFQAYALENEGTIGAELIGAAASDFHASIIQAFSDDHEVHASQTAAAGAVKDMALTTLLPSQDTPQNAIDNLADWITQYERDTGSQPSTKDIKNKGNDLGVQWTSKYPTELSSKAKELWPGWQAIQDQLQTLNLPDYE